MAKSRMIQVEEDILADEAEPSEILVLEKDEKTGKIKEVRKKNTSAKK